jgi:hypothetical protein
VRARFVPATDGTVTGVRFHKAAGDPGTHTGRVWSASGRLLGTVDFTGESASGWQTATFSTPVEVTGGEAYVVSVWTSAGRYGYTAGYFTEDRVNGPLTGPATSASAPNGVYQYGGGGVFPSGSGNGSNYWVDAIFEN